MTGTSPRKRRASRWLHGVIPLLALAFVHPAEAQRADRLQLAREIRELLDRRFERPEPRASTEVTLALSVDHRRPLEVGDVLSFRLSVRNGSSRRLTVPAARCPFWSTREPYDEGYVLELLSESGELVPMALGWADEDCAALTGDEPYRPVVIEPGDEAPLELPPEVMRDVRRSARPGRYRMRVRYLDGPRVYASNEVEVVIAGGSEQLWACRRAMIEALGGTIVRYEQPTVVPADPRDPRQGLLVLFARNATEEVDSGVSVELARVGADGVSGPSRTLLRGRAPFSGRIEAAWSSRGLIVAAELRHGSVSLAHVEVGASGAARVTRSAEIGASHPDYFSLAARGDRVALVYGDVPDQPLYLSLFDGRGVARGAPIEVTRRVRPEHVAVSLDDAGGWIAWSDGRSGLRLRRFSPRGELGSVHEVPVVAELGALRGDAAGADLALVERFATGMRTIAVRVGADGSIARRGPIGEPTHGDLLALNAAWAGDRLGAALSTDLRRLLIAAGGARHELSRAAPHLPRVTPWGDGFAVAWADERDDGSPSCRVHRGCVTEIYVAAVDGSGALQIAPSRVTHGARPEPRPIIDDDWERDCALTP